MQSPPPFVERPSASPASNTGAQSTLNLEPNVAAALSYIWIVGVVVLFSEKENRLVRFHAAQSVVFGATMLVAIFALIFIVMIVPFLLTFVGIASGSAGAGFGAAMISFLLVFVGMILMVVVPLILLILLIVCAVKAYNNRTFKLPLIGRLAEKIAFRQ